VWCGVGEEGVRRDKKCGKSACGWRITCMGPLSYLMSGNASLTIVSLFGDGLRSREKQDIVGSAVYWTCNGSRYRFLVVCSEFPQPAGLKREISLVWDSTCGRRRKVHDANPICHEKSRILHGRRRRLILVFSRSARCQPPFDR
jgi:hypothetical protein